MAGNRSTPDPHWLVSQPIAHRGLHGNGIPENSLAAFRAAMAGNFAIECDVRLSSDGEVIVFHDSDLQRLTGMPGTLEQTAWVRLQTMCLLRSEERVPSLPQMLDLVAGKTPILIEIKSGTESWEALPEAVAALLKTYSGPVAIQAFDFRMIRWFRNHAPEIPRGQLVGGRNGNSAIRLGAEWMAGAFAGADFFGCRADLLPNPWMRGTLRKGKPVLAWTVRSPEEKQRLQALGVNAIFEQFLP